MNILSIGNSYSQDAQRYLHKVAKIEGEDFHTVNLYIGGCPLSKHYENLQTNKKEYSYELNGESTGLFVSIKQALKICKWDIVTIQQASYESYDYSKYQPYANELVKVIKKTCPDAKLYIHQTWGYATGSEALKNRENFKTMEDMSKKVFESYDKLYKEINADGIIRDGEAMLSLHNYFYAHEPDGIHSNHGYGRYTLSCVWYKTLTGKDVKNNFNLFDVEVTKKQQKIARKIANNIVK